MGSGLGFLVGVNLAQHLDDLRERWALAGVLPPAVGHDSLPRAVVRHAGAQTVVGDLGDDLWPGQAVVNLQSCEHFPQHNAKSVNI